MMPMFRHFARGTVRATMRIFSAGAKPAVIQLHSGAGVLLLPVYCSLFTALLPAVVRERLIRLSHAMNVFLLLHRCAAAIGCVEQLSRKLVDHPLFAACTAEGHEPADGERCTAL